MKTTKTILSALVAAMLILTACKKDKTPQPLKEEILITGLPAWQKEADLVVKTETTLNDADYEKVKAAVGGVEVKLEISGNLQTLPYSSRNNNLGLISVFYHKWDGNKLTIYRQKNIVTLEAQDSPGDLQLVFYALK